MASKFGIEAGWDFEPVNMDAILDDLVEANVIDNAQAEGEEDPYSDEMRPLDAPPVATRKRDPHADIHAMDL